MKLAIFFFSILLFLLSSIVFAECNIQVATAAGKYLATLEEAKLLKYQNNSVCEVLNYEFWNCSEKQKSKLKTIFDLKNVLGNICMPHLPPPISSIDKKLFTKGANLYSWKDPYGYLWFALLPGTNRTQNTKELSERKISSGYLKLELKNLPSNIQVTWNNLITIEDKSKLEFTLPEDKILKEILKSAETLKLTINIAN